MTGEIYALTYIVHNDINFFSGLSKGAFQGDCISLRRIQG